MTSHAKCASDTKDCQIPPTSGARAPPLNVRLAVPVYFRASRRGHRRDVNVKEKLRFLAFLARAGEGGQFFYIPVCVAYNSLCTCMPERDSPVNACVHYLKLL